MNRHLFIIRFHYSVCVNFRIEQNAEVAPCLFVSECIEEELLLKSVLISTGELLFIFLFDISWASYGEQSPLLQLGLLDGLWAVIFIEELFELLVF